MVLSKSYIEFVRACGITILVFAVCSIPVGCATHLSPFSILSRLYGRVAEAGVVLLCLAEIRGLSSTSISCR